jgi:hypothetical protein
VIFERLAVVLELVDVGVARQEMRRQNRIRIAGLVEERCYEGRPRALEMDPDAVGIELVDARDQVVADRTADVVIRIHDRVPGEDHVVGCERFAVVPQDVAPEVVRDRLPVG